MHTINKNHSLKKLNLQLINRQTETTIHDTTLSALLYYFS